MLNVLIPEIIPAQNKGEEAIMIGIQSTLEDLPVDKIYLYSTNCDYDREKYSDEVKIISDSLIPYARLPKIIKVKHIIKHIPKHIIYALLRKLNKKYAVSLFRTGLYQVYNEIDFVLAAHDNAYAVMHNVLIFFCRFIGIPIIIYATSIKSYIYERRIVKHLSRIALSKADLITTREHISYDIIRNKVGVRGNHIKVTGDKAFLVKAEDRDVALSIFKEYNISPDKETIIGITVVYKTDVFLNCLKNVNDIDEKLELHWSIMADFTDYIIKKTDAKIVFFPHSIGPDEKSDDRIAARGVYARSGKKDKIILIEKDYSVKILKSMIGCCEFFVSERTHAAIGAASSCVPFLGLTYEDDYRTHGILGQMIAMNQCLYDLGNLQLKTLCKLFDKAWETRNEIKTHLKKQIPTVIEKAMLNKKYLMEVLIKKQVTP